MDCVPLGLYYRLHFLTLFAQLLLTEVLAPLLTIMT